MNFQDLKKIETAESYLDIAFRKTSKRIDGKRGSIREKDRLLKQKKMENIRIEVLRDLLKEEIKPIVKNFPDLDNLAPFYNELIKGTMDYGLLKKSLGSINWAARKIDELCEIYRKKFRQAATMLGINILRKQYYGRISSVLKQIKPNLAYLEEARRAMKGFPSVKTSVFTVCIFGFPNVGKSTLLSRLTTASPEINSYPFTTKSLNLGYIKEPTAHVQIIDTPGTLNRVDKMNPIELQAYLSIKYLADAAVYVFDPGLEYDIKKQEKLLDRLKKEFRKPVMLYLSKVDIAEKETVADLRNKYNDLMTDYNELKEKIIGLSKTKTENQIRA